MDIQQPGIQGTLPTAPYDTAPPSPPFIHVPIRASMPVILQPTSWYGNVLGLSDNQMKCITHDHHRTMAQDPTKPWRYAHRHTAQPMLDWLHLGPTRVARDQDFLLSRGITMVLTVSFLGTDGEKFAILPPRGARALGIPVHNVDSGQDSTTSLAGFRAATDIINQHIMLCAQALQLPEARQQEFLQEHGLPPAVLTGIEYEPEDDPAIMDMARLCPPPDQRRHHGRVLVCCETGNGRSAALVAAYLMAMTNADVVHAVLYTITQRFCITADEPMKRVLRTWRMLLDAERKTPRLPVAAANHLVRSNKRRAGDMYNDTRGASDQAKGDSLGQAASDDLSRFENRAAHQPFVDTIGLDSQQF